ncbi:putative anti-ECFsigma factor, ChrR [Mycobacteroides abscessus subsp. massiliense]|nr:putative anti-ECFsigma factor, ChrR [Mycobacteroides abscessus subsp. massiliense]SLK99157.1 putative anti-ECFsigma factor, ChrR [Mycobacteroides abscessus subsp. massiliense]
MTAAHGDPAQCRPNAPGYAWRSAADVDPIELFPGVTIQPLWEATMARKR